MRGQEQSLSDNGAACQSQKNLDFALPGGGSLQVPVRDYVSAGGARLEAAGVRADVDAPLPTVAGLRAGGDPALEVAAKVALEGR